MTDKDAGPTKRERFICTAATPWREEMGPPAFHPDAEEIDWTDYEDGSTTGRYKCPNGKHRGPARECVAL